MPYRYLDDETTVDVAFEAEAESAEELFREAWEATLRLMIEDPASLTAARESELERENDSVEMLLFDFLGELLYRKDAEGALYRVTNLELRTESDGVAGGGWLRATLEGEPIDSGRHALGVDIKAVTLYAFRVERRDSGWFARVVLDS